MMTTMKHMTHRLGLGAMALGATLAGLPAWAVNDLPGGPAVNQLDLHPPVTRIATDVQVLRSLPRPLARWALRRWITVETGGGYPPDAASVDRVLGVVDGQVRAVEIVGGWRVARTVGRLRIERPAKRP